MDNNDLDFLKEHSDKIYLFKFNPNEMTQDDVFHLKEHIKSKFPDLFFLILPDFVKVQGLDEYDVEKLISELEEVNK